MGRMFAGRNKHGQGNKENAVIDPKDLNLINEECIVVVDDEAGLREIYVAFLEGEGYRVYAAADPVAAFEIASKQRVWLYITDYRMPALDGGNFTDMVKERDENTFVVMISGYAEEAIVTFRSCEFAPDAIINKPIAYDKLIDIVDGFAKKQIARITHRAV